ncbi:MAG: hypothetical protein IPK20_11880 [Betaproteobacteria bacterium]|nr:hypothetical protein [Betaproteobacteria bacterium]
MSAITFEYAWPAAAFLAALPVLVWAGLKSSTALGPAQRRVLLGVRVLVLACVTAALMRPVALSESQDVSVVYALDVSRSVDPAFVDAAIGWMQKADALGKPAQSRFVAFADRVRRAESPEAIRRVPLRVDGKGAADGLDPLVSDIEGALAAVGSSFADDRLKRVVLMTDGLETRGDAARALDALRARHVRVFTVPATVRAAGDARIESIEVPREFRRDEPTVVHVLVFAQAAVQAQVTLRRDSKVLGRQTLKLAAGIQRVPFTVRIPDSGGVSLTAEVAAAGDLIAENNAFTTAASVLPRPRVLYIESAADSARYAKDALTAQGFDVQVALPE